MEIDEFMMKAIEIAEHRFAALEIAKLALKQYASGRHYGADPARLTLNRITDLEREIGSS